MSEILQVTYGQEFNPFRGLSKLESRGIINTSRVFLLDEEAKGVVTVYPAKQMGDISQRFPDVAEAGDGEYLQLIPLIYFKPPFITNPDLQVEIKSELWRAQANSMAVGHPINIPSSFEYFTVVREDPMRVLLNAPLVTSSIMELLQEPEYRVIKL